MMLIQTGLTFQPGAVGFDALKRTYREPVAFRLTSEAEEMVAAGASLVDDVLAHHEPVYGITTGFGSNAGVRVPVAHAAELQRRLMLSHAVGTGPCLSDDIVRLIMFLKINSLAQGACGVRPMLIEHLLKLLGGGAAPCVPAKGSVGASGDLAPLAHIGVSLMGFGRMRFRGEPTDASQVLAELGLKPFSWRPKEGLSLINGTQASTALALAGLFRAETLLATALVAGGLSTEALFGSPTSLDARLHALRRQVGQARVAGVLRDLLDGGPRRNSSQRPKRGQDPYSLRCQPQVMGACLDQLRNAAEVLLYEANSVTDNPILFTGDDGFEVVNGGNFHAEPVAMISDNMALAIAEIGSLSERRTAVLVDSRFSELPAFLAMTEGLDSGFMIAHVTAAALVGENKCLAHPASVDSIPTSANQEDHVSMATHAARRLSEMAQNAETVVAIEMLAACQGIDLCPHPPLAPKMRAAYERVRSVVPMMDEDRYLAPDIEAVSALVRAGAFCDLVPDIAFPTRTVVPSSDRDEQ